MPTFRVLSPLFDGRYHYAPGDTLELDAETSVDLVALDVIEPMTAEGVGSLAEATASEPDVGRLPPPETTLDAALVNLNQATLEQLTALPGVGKATANKLIAARPFATLADAQTAAELPDKTWETLTTLVEVT